MSQTKYALDNLEHDKMSDCTPMGTPMMPKTKGLTSQTPVSYPTHYRNIVGALQYLTLLALISSIVLILFLNLHIPLQKPITKWSSVSFGI